MQYVCANAQICGKILFLGKMSFLLCLSLQDFTDLHVEALQVFFNCLSDSESEQEIHQNGGLERLIEFILTSTEPEIQFIAIKCIIRVAEKCKYDRRNGL